jgi:predicted metal-binding membrane protein
LVIGGALLAIALLAWAYLVRDARQMDAGLSCCSAQDFLSPIGAMTSLFVMWSVMMVAMMLPTALPMVLTFAAVARNRRQAGRSYTPAAVFVSGYVLVWCAFSAAAAVTQWWLNRHAVLSPNMASTSAIFAGALLVLAGAFQFTPLKRACLRHCRGTLEFITTRWREGTAGALRMGIEHGAFCTGCCWALMLLLFLLGVMNLYWVALLTMLVCVEKMLPARLRISSAVGVILFGWGLFILVQAQAKIG